MGTVKTDALSTTYDSAVYELGTKYVQSADEVAANGSGVSTTTTLTDAEKHWKVT